MKYNKVQSIYFSPTNTTQTIVRELASSTQLDVMDDIDITFPSDSDSDILIKDTLLFIGVPVYGGRVAPVALKRLKRIKGKNSPCVIVVVYGNRDYDDALLELRNEVTKLGFTPIAASAFIGEHSYSTEKYPIASSRPDKNDILIAHNFGNEVVKCLNIISSLEEVSEIKVKGNYPYKEYNPSPSTPQTDEKLCTQCGYCISICPMECIKIEDEIVSDPNCCIKCCACVKKCPNNARVFNSPYSQLLSTKCVIPKEPDVYFLYKNVK